MKIHFISSPVVDEDGSWQLSGVHDVSGSYQSENTQTTVEEFDVKLGKGVTHDLLVEVVNEQWLRCIAW